MGLDKEYLEKGLTCMSRSMTKSVWPAHFGAAMVDGLGALIRAFDTIRFGVYIVGKGKRVDEMGLSPDDDLPSGSEPHDLVTMVFSEFLKFEKIYDLDVHKAQVGHLITHGHALVELADTGYSDLYSAGVTPLKIKVKLLRKAQTFRAPVKWKACEASELDPREPSYWRKDFDRSDCGHVFKYPFSFHNLIDRCSDSDLVAASRQHFKLMV